RNLQSKIGLVAARGRAMLSDIDKTSKELARAKEEMECSNKELEQFAYVVSHDLQEPLRSVVGYLQLLEQRYKDIIDADADKFLSRAVAATKRMQTLIKDLLTYSRVGTRGNPFESVDCETVFARAAANLKAAIKESRAVVTHDPLPEVMADTAQLTQLFQNLISNAVKFRREEAPRVHVSAKSIYGFTECLRLECPYGTACFPWREGNSL
ncbi:MAG: histidine kinase dimerization/phospho-acceptor domain-containing protein, partial [bacterium]|nr:histidine kinase dimerization/phospho-acceptor domain-containing protein [bacterium]